METRPRPTTQTNSKTPSPPRLRWPVGEHCELQPTRSRSPHMMPHSSGSGEQMFGADEQVLIGRVLIKAQIAAPLVGEFVQKSSGLFQKTVIDTCAVKPMLVVAAAEDWG